MLLEWLEANAGPVIRYRVQKELMDTSDAGSSHKIMQELLKLPQSQKRLDLLKNLDINRVHGSNNTYLENVLPMLSDFGINYESDVFRNIIKDKQITFDTVNINSDYFSTLYNKVIAYPFLLRSKFPVKDLFIFAVERIETIYDFTKHQIYDIYDKPENHKSVPKPFRDRPIIKPEIAYGDMCRLPMIYDIVTMAEVYYQVSQNVQTKIDGIINYVLSPDYNVVIPGYGILATPKRSYYSMGWDCKKPFNDKQDYSYRNLHRLLLYSSFPTAVKSSWFQNAINFIVQFKTSNKTYIFPKEYLPETDSNWILGTRMSLAENRRKKNWIEIESTFYMQKLLCLLTD